MHGSARLLFRHLSGSVLALQKTVWTLINRFCLKIAILVSFDELIRQWVHERVRGRSSQLSYSWGSVSVIEAHLWTTKGWSDEGDADEHNGGASGKDLRRGRTKFSRTLVSRTSLHALAAVETDELGNIWRNLDANTRVGFEARMTKLLDMLDPLNGLEPGGAKDEDGYGTPTRDDKENGLSMSEAELSSAVLSWSVGKVKKWLETSVFFEQDRLQEFVHVFQREGVDGLGLLTLQRSHRACVGMSDTEWLLLKASRRRLLTHGEKGSLSQLNKLAVEEVLGVLTPPSTPTASRGQNGAQNGFGVKDSHDGGLFGSPRKWSIPGLRWGHARDDQLESLREEVMSLRGEIVGAEERETTLQAQLDHLDEVLRTSQLSGYIHTRTRWTALPGEPPILDETHVDDWMLRFLVLRGSTICFYLRATDLRPQGTILLHEIVDAGPIPRKMHHKGDRRWSAFQITTCHGLRLECSSLEKIQIDTWLQSIGSSFVKIGRKKAETLDRPLSGAWLKILPVDTEECLSQEFDLFGGKA